MSVSFLLTLITLLAGAGAADNLLAYRHKKGWHDKAVRFWIRLDGTAVPDLPRLLARWVVSKTEIILKASWKAGIVYLIAFTVFLTFAAAFLNNGYQPKGPTVQIKLTPREKSLPQDIFDSSPLPHVGVLLTVAYFDMATLMLTLSAMRSLQRSNRLSGSIIFLSHLTLLIFVAITCLATTSFVSNTLFNNNALGVRYQKRLADLLEIDKFNYYAKQPHTFNSGQILSTNTVVISSIIQDSFASDWIQAAKNVYHIVRGQEATEMPIVSTIFDDKGNRIRWIHGYETLVPRSSLLLVGTLALPAIGVMLLLAFLFVAKIILSICRGYSLYFIDLATQPPYENFKPFFLIACSADVLLLIMKLLKHMISVI